MMTPLLLNDGDGVYHWKILASSGGEIMVQCWYHIPILSMTFSLTLFASLLALLAEGRYIVSILQGKSKPSFSGWFLFTVSMFCILVSAYTLGARDSIALIATFASLNAVIAALALKYGYVHFSRTDIVLFGLTLIGVLLWWWLSDPWYALIISILIDMFGYVAMTRKLWNHPGTEDRLSWALSVAAYGLNLAILSRWTPEEYLFLLSNVIWCGITFALTFRPKQSEGYPNDEFSGNYKGVISDAIRR
jgi:hypothetical protein